METKSIDSILQQKMEGEVKIRGWIHHKRTLGKINFLLIRDGTGIIQTTWKEDLASSLIQLVEKLPVESVVEVFGVARVDERAPGGVEIVGKDIKVISKAQEDYPIARKYHGPEFLLDNRHLWIRNEKMQAMLKIRAGILAYIREWFEKHGFVEVQAPMIITAACEGGATLFEVNYFGRKAYLTQSSQLYLEAFISSLGKVYTIAPSFRAEKSRTRRHLTEYWHLSLIHI